MHSLIWTAALAAAQSLSRRNLFAIVEAVLGSGIDAMCAAVARVRPYLLRHPRRRKQPVLAMCGAPPRARLAALIAEQAPHRASLRQTHLTDGPAGSLAAAARGVLVRTRPPSFAGSGAARAVLSSKHGALQVRKMQLSSRCTGCSEHPVSRVPGNDLLFVFVPRRSSSTAKVRQRGVLRPDDGFTYVLALPARTCGPVPNSLVHSCPRCPSSDASATIPTALRALSLAALTTLLSRPKPAHEPDRREVLIEDFLESRPFALTPPSIRHHRDAVHGFPRSLMRYRRKSCPDTRAFVTGGPGRRLRVQRSPSRASVRKATLAFRLPNSLLVEPRELRPEGHGPRHRVPREPTSYHPSRAASVP